MGFLQPIFQNIWGGLLYLPMPWQAVIVIIPLMFCLPFIFLRFVPWLIAKFLQIAFTIGYLFVYIVFWFISLIETPLCNVWDGIADILRGVEWFFQRLLRLIEKIKESSYKLKNSAFQYKWLLKNKVFYLSPLIVVILWFSRPLLDSIPSIASIIDTSIGAWCSLEHWNMTGQWKPSELTCSYPTRASRWDINFKFIEYQTKQKILDITEKIAKKPQDALLVNRGDLFLNIEEYTSAKKDFDKALSLNENYAPAYVGRGKVYLELGDEDKAYTEFSLALEKDPKYPPAFTGRGDVYRKKNDKEAALIEYQKAYELDPQNPLTYYGRGNLQCYSFGNQVEAVKDLNRAEEIYRTKGDLVNAWKVKQAISKLDIFYKIQYGDTLNAIASRFNTSNEKISSANSDRYPSLVSNQDSIETGWEIRIPVCK